jgi:tRNA threonylcarbamoyladenosine biosynthesis protein TsaB
MSELFLAIDSATDILSVAAGEIPAVAAGAHAQGARRHAAEILRLVDFVLTRIGAGPGDLDGLVLGDGPGSFTGLRIGWAVAKGLTQETGCDVIAIPSLLAAAAGGAQRAGAVPVAACFDALRGQVYGAMYVVHADRIETLMAPTLGTIPELGGRAPVRPALVVGDGAVRYPDEARAWSGTAPVGLDQLPPAATMHLALCRKPGAGREVADFAVAEPVYGRPAEAQAKWEARHGRPLPHPPSAPR